MIKELEKQEELRIAYMLVKEHQETIDKLKGLVSEKTDEVSNMQVDLENSNAVLKAQVFYFLIWEFELGLLCNERGYELS